MSRKRVCLCNEVQSLVRQRITAYNTQWMIGYNINVINVINVVNKLQINENN